MLGVLSSVATRGFPGPDPTGNDMQPTPDN
jgi:hypothetical protein